MSSFERLRLPAWTAAAALLCASFSVSYTQSFLGLSLFFGFLEWIRRRQGPQQIPLPFLAASGLFVWLILDWCITAFLNGNTLRGLLRGEAADLFLCLFGLHLYWLLRRDPQNARIVFYGFLGFGLVMALAGTASLFTEHRLARLIYGKGFLAASETRPQHLFGIFGGLHIYRPIGLLNNRLTYAGLLLLIIPVMIHIFLTESGRSRKLALSVALAAIVLLFFNGTRSALAGLAVAAGWMIVTALPAQKRIAGALLLLALAFAGGLAATSMLRQTDFQRPILWTAAFEIFAASPFTGAGPGQFESALLVWKAAAAQKFPLAWYYLESTPTGHAHNDFLHLLSTGGIPAGLLFLGLAASSLRGYAGHAGWMIAGLAGFFIAGLAQCYFQDDETVILFWAVLGTAESLRTDFAKNGADYPAGK